MNDSISTSQAWEKLLLTKLNWNVNLVVPQDYLNLLHLEIAEEIREMAAKTKGPQNPLHDVPLSGHDVTATPPTGDNQRPTAAKDETTDQNPTSTVEDEEDEDTLRDADLICSLCCQSLQIFAQHPSRLLSFCCMVIALKQRGLMDIAIADEHVLMDRLLIALKLGHQYSIKMVTDLICEIQCLIFSLLPLPLSRESSPVKPSYASVLKTVSPHKSPSPTSSRTSSVRQNQESPFRITTSSTPKSRHPLTEYVTNVQEETRGPRRRLISVDEVTEEVRSSLNLSGNTLQQQRHHQDAADKENNDSAIGGMLLNVTPRTPDLLERLSSSSASGSSKESSPGDSGASSADSPVAATSTSSSKSKIVDNSTPPTTLSSS